MAPSWGCGGNSEAANGPLTPEDRRDHRKAETTLTDDNPLQVLKDNVQSHIQEILPGETFEHIKKERKKETAIANEHKLYCWRTTGQKVEENHKVPNKTRHRT